VNPSEKSPTFRLRDESHGHFFKTPQAFSSPGEKPRHLWRERGTYFNISFFKLIYGKTLVVSKKSNLECKEIKVCKNSKSIKNI
jgi:hypothetical protein